MHWKSRLRSAASRSVVLTRPWGAQVGEAGRGHLDIRLDDLMVEAQVLVDVGGGHLACGNGPDDGGGAGDAVAAGEHALHAPADCVLESARMVPPRWTFDAGLLKAVGLDALADGHDDDVRGDAHLGHVRRVGRRAAGAVDVAR